ncbi:RecT-like DNA pairing protein [Arthrobacter phage Daob]|uniref:RecT-like DNA pairing protein n=7 Tax=Coralvirus coral TaxID=2734227 RepID=A0A5J6TQN3_9CAUD|nr:RecT-like ssDNA annealing protein [Arthrobacter phage Coral]AYN57616.1 RecT-like DNA pairing protein [Arthrobacter phage Cote]AYN57690.1 RecT-like DNA pairing protein [Arthrobacter phage Daob]AYN58448.1 RecT-like DNA pairing protein [Arthrobacter phage Lunar]AYN58590.1 RecT-like DNA pairing protein [Arthrobacter phage Melons]AYN58797.1 RecT-like DNA pairing protein [Arthrobacter phage Polka]QFG13093.1 RecT-like DNA pairing protein [Arthrobacter phage Amelia]
MATADNGALAATIGNKQAETGRASAFDLVRSMEAEFKKALPKHVPVEQFMRTGITELRQNVDLQRCGGPSLLGAFLTAARLGLEVGGPMGEYYLTPRQLRVPGGAQNEKEWQVVPIIGYRGLVKLARNAGVGAVKAWVVYEGDHFLEGADSERGPFFEFRPEPGDVEGRKEAGALAVARLAGGDVQHVYLTIKQVEARKARGAAGDKGPWASDRAAMIRKTAVRALAGELPQSTLLALARVADEQVQQYVPGEIVDAPAGEIEA